MPSSLIFAGLVVLWLLILVPTVARRRQEVARPSTAALSGRVLERRRPGGAARRVEEVDEMREPDEFGPEEVPDGAAGDDLEERARRDGHDDHRVDRTPAAEDDHPVDDARDGEDDHPVDDARDGEDEPRRADAGWEPPAPRYRPGRGGFDPQAAAIAARARYAFRQRVVLALLVSAAVTAVAAVFLGTPLWWVHGAIDAVLVTYLTYLRRQVRLEEAIRARRAARMAGTRRPAAADDPELDAWARRGREVAGRRAAEPDDETGPEATAGPATGRSVSDLGIGVADGRAPAGADERADGRAGDRADERAGDQAGDGGEEAADGRADEAPEEPALPRLRPVAPPPLPSGTAPLALEDLDPDLPAVDRHAPRYRRAAGQ